MKFEGLCAAMMLVAGLFAAMPTVTFVTAQQRYPWNGKVDIVVTLSGASNDVAQAECTFTATNSATQAALATAHIAETGTMTGSGMTWTRTFIWNATADVGGVKIADVALYAEVQVPLGGVQLWEGGPYWAECNVGASQPWEYGYYFWWGDTVGYKRNASNNGWVSVKDGSSFSFSSCPTYGMNDSMLQSAGYIDSMGNLSVAHDAATAHLGAPWRVPTAAEIDALSSNCTTTWTTNGVVGWFVTGKGAYSSKSIFLPATGYGNGSELGGSGSYGYYWSSTPNSNSSNSRGSSFSSHVIRIGPNNFCRDLGLPVRPLRGFAK